MDVARAELFPPARSSPAAVLYVRQIYGVRSPARIVRGADKGSELIFVKMGSLSFDALGEATLLTDPNGIVHAYAYDALGRQTSDAVTTLAAGADGGVRRLQTAYDAGGQSLPRPSSTDPGIPHFPPRTGRALPEVGEGDRNRARSDSGNPTPRPR